MARIFLSLALLALLLMGVNLLLGLTMGDYGGLSRDYSRVLRELNQIERAGQGETEAGLLLKSRRAALRTALLPIQDRMIIHLWTGILATLVTILVNSVSVTYFIGTNRWCKEVVETYGLDSALSAESAGLKSRAFPWAAGSIFLVLVVATLGAAADPAGILRERSVSWVTPHLVIALIAFLLIGWSFFVQVGKIGLNTKLIERILAEVNKQR